MAGLGLRLRYADPPPVAEHIGALDAVVAPYRSARLIRAASRDYLVNAN